MARNPMEGAAPFSASNGPSGVLVLHGFTGTPRSMRPLADAFADAGFSVELPLLPGHGTSPEDLEPKRFDDWSSAAEEAFLSLAARTDRTAVVGLSMGGTLACWLAERHVEVAGLVLVNPLVQPPAPEAVELLRGALEAGVRTMPTIGSDIAKPATSGGGYDATPVAPLVSLLEATVGVAEGLGEIACPVLLLSSRVDHVVPTDSGDLLERAVAGPVERVWLERSYHVATLDHDAAELEARAVGFVHKLMAA
ncbi:MAG TPA: alpha/beta fold hydrolase [Acidimicrobiales bacterium]|nr:alpha/beta fold hydrolase [Acidimicrobiales bacterium]